LSTIYPVKANAVPAQKAEEPDPNERASVDVQALSGAATSIVNSHYFAASGSKNKTGVDSGAPGVASPDNKQGNPTGPESPTRGIQEDPPSLDLQGAIIGLPKPLRTASVKPQARPAPPKGNPPSPLPDTPVDGREDGGESSESPTSAVPLAEIDKALEKLKEFGGSVRTELERVGHHRSSRGRRQRRNNKRSGNNSDPNHPAKHNKSKSNKGNNHRNSSKDRGTSRGTNTPPKSSPEGTSSGTGSGLAKELCLDPKLTSLIENGSPPMNGLSSASESGPVDLRAVPPGSSTPQSGKKKKDPGRGGGGKGGGKAAPRVSRINQAGPSSGDGKPGGGAQSGSKHKSNRGKDNHKSSRNRKNKSGKSKRTVQPKGMVFIVKKTPSGKHKKGGSGDGKRGSKPPRPLAKNVPPSAEVEKRLAEARKLVQQDLAKLEEMQRIELRAIQARINQSRTKVLDLHRKANHRITVLRKLQRSLSSFAEDLSRLGRMKNDEADEVLSQLTQFDEQRKGAVARMVDPQWTKPHCFYMFAIEHFRGNKQNHLIELAEAMPGGLAITALAACSVQRQAVQHSRFDELNAERTLLEERLGTITKRREVCRAHLKDYKKMLAIMKQQMPREDRQKLRRIEREARKKAQQGAESSDNPLTAPSAKLPAPPLRGPMGARGGGNWRRSRLQALRTPSRPGGMPGPSPPTRPLTAPKQTNHRDIRRKLLRATGVVEAPRNQRSVWQTLDVREFVATIDKFLQEGQTDDILKNVRALDATTRQLFFGGSTPRAGPGLPPRLAPPPDETASPSASPLNSPENNPLPTSPSATHTKSPSLEPGTGLVPSPIAFGQPEPSNALPVLTLGPAAQPTLDGASPPGGKATPTNASAALDGALAATPLYNRDWSVLADILKNSAIASKAHQICFKELTRILDKKENMRAEADALEQDYKDLRRIAANSKRGGRSGGKGSGSSSSKHSTGGQKQNRGGSGSKLLEGVF